MKSIRSDGAPLRIGIVENDLAYAERLRGELENYPATVQIWETAETYWRDPQAGEQDLLLLDILLPGMSGVDLAGLVSIRYPDVRKLIVTTVDTEATVFQALRFGCLGFILKAELADIRRAVTIVIEGGAIITPTVALRVAQSFDQSPEIQSRAILTTREQQVLEEMLTGRNVPSTADVLGVSVHTVRNHVKSIYQKLSVSNRQEMMRRARELGYDY